MWTPLEYPGVPGPWTLQSCHVRVVCAEYDRCRVRAGDRACAVHRVCVDSTSGASVRDSGGGKRRPGVEDGGRRPAQLGRECRVPFEGPVRVRGVCDRAGLSPQPRFVERFAG